jgi:DNA (cytosine-5)-methyltransferase 1
VQAARALTGLAPRDRGLSFLFGVSEVSKAYYNEIDPYAAQWLRNLIAANLIAPGDVDERDIRDVCPADLDGYTQCHFFAGVGVWSYALRRAGWSDNVRVWTGSCPCQPFSAAGRGGGFDDERHLWPAFQWLIAQCGPRTVFGEQVASKDGLAWLDVVQADMEGTGHAFGAVDLCAAGVGAPHIRQRLWFVGERGVGQADAYYSRSQGRGGVPCGAVELAVGTSGVVGGVALPHDTERRTDAAGRNDGDRAHAGRAQGSSDAQGCGEPRGVADADGGHASAERQQPGGEHGLVAADGGTGVMAEPEGEQHDRAGNARGGRGQPSDCGATDAGLPRPTNGLWRDADWIYCRDHKWRPVEPGTFPLAHGAPARVGRLRAYGNAINAEAAVAVIESYMEARRAA